MRTRLGWALAILAAALGARASEQGERYALLVGVGEYRSDSGLDKLKFPETDMVALRDTLKDIGFEDHNIRLMVKSARDERLNPRRENIVNELKLLLDNKRKEDVVIVVLSGHGLQPRDKDEAFFCPSDATLTKMDTWLEMDAVFKLMKECGAGGKLLIADCCRDDPKLKNMRGAPLEVQSVTRPAMLKPPQTVSVLLSCANGQAAFEEEDLHGGVFTYFLIKGLRGKAALNGEVEVKTLASYLQRNVYDYVSAKRGAQQNPTFKSDSDIPLVLARVGQAGTSVVSSNRLPIEVTNEPGARRAQTVDASTEALFEQAYEAWDFDNDHVNGKRLYEAIIAKLSSNPATRNAPECLFAQLILDRPDNNPKGTWPRASALAEQAVNGFKAEGKKRWLGIALQQHASTFMPSVNPGGNWTTATAIFEDAYKAELESGDTREQADCLWHLACCHDPINNPGGSRTKAATYYAEAAKLAAGNVKTYVLSGNKKLLAASLLMVANCEQPQRNPAGSYEKCATAAADAAAAYKELGQPGLQADCVWIQAISSQPDYNKNGNYSTAAKLYMEAATLFGNVKREADQAACLFSAGYCLRPNINKESNWNFAALSFQAAALLYEKLNDKNGLGGALLNVGYALTQQNNGQLTPQNRATFERAAKLLRETNDKRATEAESWLKKK